MCPDTPLECTKRHAARSLNKSRVFKLKYADIDHLGWNDEWSAKERRGKPVKNA